LIIFTQFRRNGLYALDPHSPRRCLGDNPQQLNQRASPAWTGIMRGGHVRCFFCVPPKRLEILAKGQSARERPTWSYYGLCADAAPAEFRVYRRPLGSWSTRSHVTPATQRLLIDSARYSSDGKPESVTRQERGPCRQSRCEFGCHTQRHLFDIAVIRPGWGCKVDSRY